MSELFFPDPGWEFAQNEVLAHWHHTACRQDIARIRWQDYVDDPFV